MGIDCLKCVNSACCQLVVEVSRVEYKEYEKKGLESNFKTHIDDFLNRFPRLENKKEYLKKHIEESNIPEEHYENEIGEMMEWYADDYHQEQVKNLTIANVVGQCKHEYDHYTNTHGETVAVCSKCMDAYF